MRCSCKPETERPGRDPADQSVPDRSQPLLGQSSPYCDPAHFKPCAHGSLEMHDPKNRHLVTIAQLCRAISPQLRHVLTIGKKFVKQQYLFHMLPQYGELWPSSGWDRSGSLGHPYKFQRVSRLGSVTAWHCSGRQPDFAALNRGRHLYSAGRPSHWALARISRLGDVLGDHSGEEMFQFCRYTFGPCCGQQMYVILSNSGSWCCNSVVEIHLLQSKVHKSSCHVGLDTLIANILVGFSVTSEHI